jgi:hypothetical protein
MASRTRSKGMHFPCRDARRQESGDFPEGNGAKPGRAASARGRYRRVRSAVDAEAAVPCQGRKTSELGSAHVNQGRVISTFEVDLGLRLDAVVDH